MTAALTPSLTLDFVRALSADVRAAVVLAADGALLAGPDALAAPARALLGTATHATLLEGIGSECAAYAARDERHAIVVLTGPFALQRVTRHDLRTALTALGGVNPVDEASTTVPEAVVNALAAAFRDGFRRPSAVSPSE